MGNFNSAPYKNATTIGNVLLKRIISGEPEDYDLGILVREWREVEQMKREWRGIPRLSVHKLGELLSAKRDNMRNITSTNAPAYTDESADEPSAPPTPAPTVTTPPTP